MSAVAEDEGTSRLTPIMRSRRQRRRNRQSLWSLLAAVVLVVAVLLVGYLQLRAAGLSHGRSFQIQEFVVCRLFEAFLGIWIFIVGCCIASFLNVVAYRLPAGLPITGYSFCPHCRVPIKPSDNVPVLGWFLLGGRCRACKLKISIRYPIIEFMGGLLLLSLYFSTILGHGHHLPLPTPSDLPYGLPVNLRFMDEKFFYIAALHAWLLFFLYAGGLTRLGGVRLPIKAWLLGGTAVVLAVAWRPELCIVPLESRLLSAISQFLAAIPVSPALLVSAIGLLTAFGLGCWWQAPKYESDWIAACCLIGLTLGWQAVVWILGLSAASFLTIKLLSLHFSSLKPWHPMYALWLWTILFLLVWRGLHAWLQSFGSTGAAVILGLIAGGSVFIYRSIRYT